jgi:hypothetical protein
MSCYECDGVDPEKILTTAFDYIRSIKSDNVSDRDITASIDCGEVMHLDSKSSKGFASLHKFCEDAEQSGIELTFDRDSDELVYNVQISLKKKKK